MGFYLQDAVNLTSKLLEDASEMQNSEMKINILVSCGKLEKFVLHYASLHMTPQNDSETRLSMVQQEIGKALYYIVIGDGSNKVQSSLKNQLPSVFLTLFTKATQIHNYNTRLVAQQY